MAEAAKLRKRSAAFTDRFALRIRAYKGGRGAYKRDSGQRIADSR